MPGMIDTHRHMWQTAMRGYGADWTLTQYFVWYYLEHGKKFRPEDIHAGNLLSALESLDAGVTTTVDWSHGLQTRRPRRGRRRRAAGRCPAGSCSPTATSRPARGSGPPTRRCRSFLERLRDADDDLLGVQIAFDVTGDPAFPEKAAFEVARELGLPVTTHAGVWGATNDDGIRLMHENGFMDAGDHLRARRRRSPRTATSGSPPPAARSRCRPSPSRAPARGTRPPGRCAVTASRCRCRWTPACGGAATCSPRCGRRSAPTARASTSRRTPQGDTVTQLHLRAEHVVDWATRGGARALGRDDLGSLEPGKKADVVLIKNDDSPVSFPLLNPYGHVAFQAQRGDVHTVLVDGRVVKHAGTSWSASTCAPCARRSRPPSSTCKGEMGEEVWQPGMNPELPRRTRSSTTRTSTPTTSPTPPRGPRHASSASRGLGRTAEERGQWPDAAPDRTSSRRWRAGSTCSPASTPTTAPMTLTEVAAAAGLARPTARRLLLTLEELGYVRLARRQLRADAARC